MKLKLNQMDFGKNSNHFDFLFKIIKPITKYPISLIIVFIPIVLPESEEVEKQPHSILIPLAKA